MLQTETSYILRYALNWAIAMIRVPVSPPASDSGPQMSERADCKRKFEDSPWTGHGKKPGRCTPGSGSLRRAGPLELARVMAWESLYLNGRDFVDSHVSAESVGDFLKSSRYFSGEFLQSQDCGIVRLWRSIYSSQSTRLLSTP